MRRGQHTDVEPLLVLLRLARVAKIGKVMILIQPLTNPFLHRASGQQRARKPAPALQVMKQGGKYEEERNATYDTV